MKMAVIYDVTIKFVETENIFNVAWKNVETNTEDSFNQAAEITPEETEELWQYRVYQLTIGQKLFRLLDGDARHFVRALGQANRQGEILQVYLRTCSQTADWPFELLAENSEFLLPNRLYLVRQVSDWGKEKRITPKNRALKLLFMACSAIDVEPVLDFEAEEEAIFHITGDLPLELEVEDSGSLAGLRRRLEQEEYDIVHLSGHGNINEKGQPYFVMEDETGHEQKVFPEELWNESLIENPPRLLFLSGCRTGETPNSSGVTGALCFARLLVEKYNIPAVLGWGRSVYDEQAIHTEKMLFHELSRGCSLLDAVKRARYELQKDFSKEPEPAWPLLRLFSSGAALKPIVKKGQRWRPKSRIMKQVYLENSRVQVLGEGFVGRRRQIQVSLHALNKDSHKAGIMILGTAGLGKSCLAGKICERFTEHTLIIVHGKLNSFTLQAALKDAFIKSQDTKGRQILSQKKEMTQKLADLCATSFKEKNYLLLLDAFEHNLEGTDEINQQKVLRRQETGCEFKLLPEAAELLKTLLHYLQFSGKMTQMIITCPYDFSLTEKSRNLIEERLQKVWLTGFLEAEQRKKGQELENILNYHAARGPSKGHRNESYLSSNLNSRIKKMKIPMQLNYKEKSLIPELLAAGCGNPLLMEWLDELVGQIAGEDQEQLLAAIKDKREEFIHKIGIQKLFRECGDEFTSFLRCLSIYRRPVPEKEVKQVAKKGGIELWKEFLLQGIRIGLIEFDQVRLLYRFTPLLREESVAGLDNSKAYHKIAFAYYNALCKAQDDVDSVLSEELFYHTTNCK